MTDNPNAGGIPLTEGDNPVPVVARFYDLGQIGTCTFVFGPLAGSWFLSRNWKAFGNDGAAFRTLLTGTVGTMAMLVGVLFLPDNIPHFIVPAAYTAIISSVATSQQKAGIDALKAKGIPRASGWRAFFVGLAWLVLTVILFFAVLMIIESAFPGLIPDPDAKPK